jgi:hypothetical protein
MQKFIVVVVSVLLISTLMVIFTGCTSDTGSGTTPTVEEARTAIQGANVGYPPDEDPAYSQLTEYGIFFIDLFIQFATMYLEVPGWQGSDGTYTFSYEGDGDDFTLTLRIVWDGSKGMWHYTLTLDGTLEEVAYANFTIFDMYAATDGNSGEITFKIPESGEDYLSVTWQKGDPYYTFTMTAQSGPDSFTVTLVETPPYLVGDKWKSDSGRIRIVSGEDTFDASWGTPPPPEFD